MSLDQIADLLARHTIVAVHTGIIGGVLRQGLNAGQRSLQILAVDANEELRYHFVAGSTTEFFGRHYTPRYQEFTAKVHKNPMTGTLNLHLTGTLQSGAPVYNLGGPINYHINITLSPGHPGFVSYAHDGYPTYHVTVNATVVHFHRQQTPLSLFQPPEIRGVRAFAMD